MAPAPDTTEHQPTTPPPGGASPEPHTWPSGPGQAPQQPRGRRRFAEMGGAALLAAVLASGGTYALTNGNANAAPAPATVSTSQTQSNSSNGTATSPTVKPGSSAPNWSAVAGAVAPSVVSITVRTNAGEAAGSGVIFDAKGHILTNNHVVEGASKGSMVVTLADGRAFEASVVGTDPSTDLAVIKLNSGPDDLTPITVGRSEQLVVGDPVMAIGNPLGLSGTVTTGIVSALNRPVTTQAESSPTPFGQQAPAEPVVTNAIQTSAAINPGNSGGALVNAKGELVGINSSIAQLGSSTGGQSGNIGIGFAIPIKEAKAIATQLIEKGHADHAFLGVSIKDTTIKDGAAHRAGAEVAAVSSGTPAAKAGLKKGDVIVAANGQPIDSAVGLIATIREMTAGDTPTLTVIRGGDRQQIPVTLAVKPNTNS